VAPGAGTRQGTGCNGRQPTYVIYFSPRRFTSPRTCEPMRGRAGLRARGPPNSSKPPPGAHAENSLTRFDPADGVAALIQMGRLNDANGSTHQARGNFFVSYILI